MNQHLQDLTEIRSMMERSTRFISLSGLSGVFAGTFALTGAYFAYERILQESTDALQNDSSLLRFIATDGAIVLILSLSFSVYFTLRKAKKKSLKVWDNTSRRLLFNMAIPLVAGGLFSLILLKHAPHLIDSATLIFYGLALVNASKYTYDEVRYLGYIEIILGLICGLLDEWRLGLLFWAVGFGVLHIIYGILMYRKYES
ncbi:hypothetical protein SAMN04515674_11981 [Pseudarcicella hirudinis]|uniref:Uncharacterized protein n=1 Tax=Pseudarcicella hirudinis TaxID=1079859 RepID=A0A1I5YKT7_9BACT|nr:hypothetical protein [Pseudarcicella hirudinis]SFQ44786.1 hypothetical protein SAMN04515674_11981 [Pseudarcicella hirudinis]